MGTGMNRTHKTLRNIAWLVALGLSACAAPFNGPENVSDEHLMYPITVTPRMETLRVPFNGNISPDTDSRLVAFAKDYLENGNGAISISVPDGDSGARRYFASRLSDLGVPAWRIMIGNSETAEPAQVVELSYIRYAAEPAPCGDWSTNIADTASNMPPPNFGCATQHNLAAMVADPRDLVAPRGADAADAQRRMTVLDKYRKGQTTPAEKTAEQSGAVADVNRQ
jgi:pilus assembly protein CpaD